MWLLPFALACESAEGEEASPGESGTTDSGVGDTGSEADSGDSADTGEPLDTADTGIPVDVVVDDPVDVVIVGAGPAGLAAAIEVVAAGASVRVLEREPLAGGAANYAGGLMMFSGSAEQARVGMFDSPELLAADWPALTGGDPADPWFQSFAYENVPRVHDWLVGLGATFSGPMLDTPRGSADRIHQPKGGGPGLVAVLLDAVPGEVLTYGASVESLVVESGRVSGVRWSDGQDEHWLAADAVIVATGGFLHDLERVTALFPEIPEAQLAYGSFAGADGAGMDMLTAVGGTTQNLQAIGFYAHATLSPEAPLEELVTSGIGLYPWFNAAGDRFVDESAFRGFQVGRTRALEPGGSTWLVGDRALEDDDFFPPFDESNVYDVTTITAAGIGARADTVPELAAALGVDPDALAAEVALWNAGGTSLDPARDPAAEPGEPVTDPPFYALPIAISVAKAFGGVDVDLQGRVLDGAGGAIPGVYAAGEVTGMLGGSLVGDYGFTGSLTAVVLGGRVAGENAASEALAR